MSENRKEAIPETTRDETGRLIINRGDEAGFSLKDGSWVEGMLRELASLPMQSAQQSNDLQR